jgi:hypothetical protein
MKLKNFGSGYCNPAFETQICSLNFRIRTDATLPLRQRPLRLMDSTTVSMGTERAACTSLRKKTSKSMGTPAALKTCSTAVTSSGPTPSPGMSVAVTRSLGATWVSIGLNQRYNQRLSTILFSLVLRKEYFDCPQRDSHAVHYI